MDCTPTSSDKVTLKKWFFIDKIVGWKNSKFLNWNRFLLATPTKLYIVFWSSFNLYLTQKKKKYMDLKSNHTSPVLADPAPMNESMLGIHTGLLPYSASGTAFSSSLFLTIPRKKPGILDDVRSCAWLDAMKSSSPTHRRIAKDSGIESSKDGDIVYRNWMVISCFWYLLIFLNEEFL